jgi:glycosyltransferase involved in cell wall biosynthesis
MITLFLNAIGAHAGSGLTYLYNVVPQLSRSPGVQTVLAVRPELRPRFENFENVALASIPELRTAERRFLFEQLRLPALIRHSRADVLVCAGNFALRWSPVPQLLLSGNSLYTSPDFETDLRSRREYLMRIDNRLKGFFARKSVRWADCTVAPSQAFAEQLQRWAGKPVIAIHHGFDRRQFEGGESPLPDAASRRLAQEPDALRLLFVSHYNYYRNFETLFRAVPLICARLPGRKIQLLLTCALQDHQTPGAYKTRHASDLIAHLGIRGEVVELGPVPYPSLHALYRACDIYVTAAYTETFAHPLVEAMASGLPIVASNIPVHREVARDAALYFDRFSPEQLAEAVQRIAVNDDLRSRLAFNGKQRSLDFSWRRHTDELLDLADRLAFPLPPKLHRMSA